MKCKIFITEMGWGPIVRQSAIIHQLNKFIPNLKITIQAQKKSKNNREIF